MKIILSLLFAICVPAHALAFGEMTCGIQPIPSPGCHIGRCVNGEWEEVCTVGSFGSGLSGGNLTCGFKPMPALGCHIGQCVDGEWQQICD